MIASFKVDSAYLIATMHDITLDLKTADHFKRELLIAIQKNPDFEHIAISLDNVKMLDSTGLGALLFARRQSNLKNGKCILINPTQKIVQLLEISKLEQAFSIVDSIEDIK